MNWLRQNRLTLQLVFTLLAAVSVAGISILIIADAIESAESVVIIEANRSLASAVTELKHQQQSSASSGLSWNALPLEAKDVSLRAITQTVLRSFPGVEGGFYSKDYQFLGYAYPTHDTGGAKTDVPTAERTLIESLARQSLSAETPQYKVVRGKLDILVLASVSNRTHDTAIWVMKRLPGRANANNPKRIILLSILIAAALASIAATLATGVSLARGVTQITRGLSALEKDFNFRLPERRDELGAVSRSINKMAAVRRKLEAELRREDRLRALGRLATGLAHEIRNPLNSIRLTVQLMESRLNTGRLRREDLQTVEAEVDRLNTLLNDLLDLQRSRQPSLQFQPVLPVIEYCAGLLRRQAQMRGVALQIDASNPAVSALFDDHQLTQTLMNLLLNALEASSDKGSIHIRISERSGAVAIEVEDNGPGLDPDQQEHLFEPFYTTKASGTGLGLAVSRELMRSQGGDLCYDRTTPGARFVVRLRRN